MRAEAGDGIARARPEPRAPSLLISWRGVGLAAMTIGTDLELGRDGR